MGIQDLTVQSGRAQSEHIYRMIRTYLFTLSKRLSVPYFPNSWWTFLVFAETFWALSMCSVRPSDLLNGYAEHISQVSWKQQLDWRVAGEYHSSKSYCIVRATLHLEFYMLPSFGDGCYSRNLLHLLYFRDVSYNPLSGNLPRNFAKGGLSM